MRLAKHFGILLALLWLMPQAKADVTVLLEEPYSYDGALAGTGHSAVYLTRVCAASPTMLRRCEPGEPGVVISRYHAVAGFDWIAIPLIPYLYAVEKPEDIPLFADPKVVASLRDHYRRTHLEAIIPDESSGEAPAGNWYELVGSAYDRTLYGYQIETSPEQDDAFIAQYNTKPNREAYKFVTRNCADFVREAVNFYYPKAIGRSWVADFGVATPKHSAKSLAKYSRKHPDLQFASFVIPQVPGTVKRSTPIRGGVESVFKAKKYELPLLFFQPFVAGGFAVAYVAGGRFNASKNVMVFDLNGDLQAPLTEEERRSYSKGLEEWLRAEPGIVPGNARSSWKEFAASARLRQDDESNGPVLLADSGDTVVQVGIARGNVLTTPAPADLVRALLIERLQEELKTKSAVKISDAELRADWKLLQSIIPARSPDLLVRAEAGKRVRLSANGTQ
jgi:hypothetical protein